MDILTDITEHYTVQNIDNSAFLIDASAEDVKDTGYILVLEVYKQIQNLTKIMKEKVILNSHLICLQSWTIFLFWIFGKDLEGRTQK